VELQSARPKIEPKQRNSTLVFVAPFVAYCVLMGVEQSMKISMAVAYPMRLIVVLAVILLVSRPALQLNLRRPLLSAAIGLLVFGVWIAPDLLFGYRHSALFENFITGAAVSTMPAELRSSAFFLIVRVLGSTLIVPVIEELFWRGWLMRWLIQDKFESVQLGAYAPRAFWIVAILFAAEHGAYWEVGLVAGIIYNWWMVRTKSLADCMVAHAVTNGLLSAYVLLFHHWEYWN